MNYVSPPVDLAVYILLGYKNNIFTPSKVAALEKYFRYFPPALSIETKVETLIKSHLGHTQMAYTDRA